MLSSMMSASFLEILPANLASTVFALEILFILAINIITIARGG